MIVYTFLPSITFYDLSKTRHSGQQFTLQQAALVSQLRAVAAVQVALNTIIYAAGQTAAILQTAQLYAAAAAGVIIDRAAFQCCYNCFVELPVWVARQSNQALFSWYLTVAVSTEPVCWIL